MARFAALRAPVLALACAAALAACAKEPNEDVAADPSTVGRAIPLSADTSAQAPAAAPTPATAPVWTDSGAAPAGTTPAGTAPAGTTPAGTSPAGTTPSGTAPAAAPADSAHTGGH